MAMRNNPRRRGFFAGIVVSVASLLFAVATPSWASSTTTVRLKPPVITESFTHLPCEKNTTIGQEGCAEAQLLRADRRINREVSLMFTLLSTGSQKRAFIKAESAWLTYRGADCSSVADVYQGGSLEPVQYALCEISDDEAKSTSLQSFFTLLEQGRSSAPAWP